MVESKFEMIFWNDLSETYTRQYQCKYSSRNQRISITGIDWKYVVKTVRLLKIVTKSDVYNDAPDGQWFIATLFFKYFYIIRIYFVDMHVRYVRERGKWREEQILFI